MDTIHTNHCECFDKIIEISESAIRYKKMYTNVIPGTQDDMEDQEISDSFAHAKKCVAFHEKIMTLFMDDIENIFCEDALDIIYAELEKVVA